MTNLYESAIAAANDLRVGCSSLGNIMADTKVKSANSKIESISIEIDKLHKEIESLNPYSKRVVAKQNKIDNLVLQKKELECNSIAINAESQLSEGAKTYCKTYLKSVIYDKSKPKVQTKSMEKGTIVEADAISLISDIYDMPLISKNEKRLRNEWVKGEADVLFEDIVIDAKSSESCWTFPIFEDELPDEQYYWQVQAYMWLYGKKSASVVYTLMTTPTSILLRDAKWALGNEYTQQRFEDYLRYHNYDDTPKSIRTKRFDFDYDEKAIEKIKNKVNLCKLYIVELAEKYLKNVQ